MKLAEDCQGLRHDPAVLEPGQVSPVEVVSPADDDLNFAAVADSIAIAGIRQGGLRRVEDEELFWLPPGHGQGHHAVGQRVERDRRVEVAATLAVNAVARGGIRVEEDRRVPAVRGDVADATAAGDHVLPESRGIPRAREPAGEADEGHVEWSATAHRAAPPAGTPT